MAAATQDFPATPAKVSPGGWRRRIIHAFVLFHLAAITFWSFTSPGRLPPAGRALHSMLHWYMWPTGAWQSWVMFAPNPVRANSYVEAEITYRDGSKKIWTPPRMEQLGYFDRFRKERYRKWATERVSWMAGRPDPDFAAAAAEFAVRQAGWSPNNPPARVELVRYWSPIPPPRTRWLPRHVPDPIQWTRQPLLIGTVDDNGTLTQVQEAAGNAPPGDRGRANSTVESRGDE